MRQLLLPIDPDHPERTRAAVSEAVRIYREEAVAVHLLRVVPPVSGHVAMFFGRGELEMLQHRAGEEDLEFAASLLAAAGVPCTRTVQVGRSARTIARAARSLGCDRIVFGDEPAERAGRIFGSLAEQVRQLLAPGEVHVIGS